jgi:hypothetical protein
MRNYLTAALVIGLATTPLAAQDRTLTMGRTVQGLLRDSDPVSRLRRAPYHAWTFEGRRGQRVTFDMSSPEFDAWLAVRDAEGYLIGSDDDSGEGTDARVRAILPRDGRYTVIATAFSESGRGFYTLSVIGWEVPEAAPPGAAASLAVGQTREGILEPGDAVSGDGPFEDRWTFEALAGQRLLVQLRSEDFDAYLIVLSPGGEALGSDDDGLEGRDSQLSLRASATGRYTAIATSFGENPQTGVYRISLEEETGDFADPGVSQSIASGETRDGRLESGDRTGSRGLEDEWVFRGRAGQVARIDVTSAAFDTYATLLRDGSTIDSNDDGGEGTNSRLATMLPADGEYTLVVAPYSQSRGGGAYRVALNIVDPPVGAGRPVEIQANRVVSGRLEPGDQQRGNGAWQDVWEFEGRRDQDVTIEMNSSDFDAWLELRDDRGALLVENDDGGDGTNSLIVTRLPRNGRYRIIARSFGDTPRSGTYDLVLLAGGSAVAPPGRVNELRADQLMRGRLESGDSIIGDGSWADVWTYRAGQDGNLVIDMRSSDFDTYLIVRGPEGQILGTDDDGGSGTNSRLTVRVQRGRTYRVYANSYGSDTSAGTYQLMARFER